MLWSEALHTLISKGYSELEVKDAMFIIIEDRELDLPQKDDEERVISEAEFNMALDKLKA